MKKIILSRVFLIFVLIFATTVSIALSDDSAKNKADTKVKQGQENLSNNPDDQSDYGYYENQDTEEPAYKDEFEDPAAYKEGMEEPGFKEEIEQPVNDDDNYQYYEESQEQPENVQDDNQ